MCRKTQTVYKSIAGPKQTYETKRKPNRTRYKKTNEMREMPEKLRACPCNKTPKACYGRTLFVTYSGKLCCVCLLFCLSLFNFVSEECCGCSAGWGNESLLIIVKSSERVFKNDPHRGGRNKNFIRYKKI